MNRIFSTSILLYFIPLQAQIVIPQDHFEPRDLKIPVLFDVSQQLDRVAELSKRRQQLIDDQINQDINGTMSEEDQLQLAEEICALANCRAVGVETVEVDGEEFLVEQSTPQLLTHQAVHLETTTSVSAAIVHNGALYLLVGYDSYGRPIYQQLVVQPVPPTPPAEPVRNLAVTQPRDRRNLIVNYIPTPVTDLELRQLFEQYGEVESARVILDHETKLPKGYGFVKFKNEADSLAAIEGLNGFKLYTKRLKVGYAQGPQNGITR